MDDGWCSHRDAITGVSCIIINRLAIVTRRRSMLFRVQRDHDSQFHNRYMTLSLCKMHTNYPSLWANCKIQLTSIKHRIRSGL